MFASLPTLPSFDASNESSAATPLAADTLIAFDVGDLHDSSSADGSGGASSVDGASDAAESGAVDNSQSLGAVETSPF